MSPHQTTKRLGPVERDAHPDSEEVWLAERYDPVSPQLTIRAALTGMVLGAMMALSNLYVVLKTGWSLGVTVTACVLAFSVFRAGHALGLVRRPFGALENNAVASVASAAGYMTGGGNMAALPALLLLGLARPPAGALVVWFAAIAALGVFVAIPIKRQLVNREQLPFPTGTATAETIRALHGHGDRSSQVAWLAGAALAGAILVWARDAHLPGLPALPDSFGLPFTIAGIAAGTWGLAMESSVLMVGAGALISFRTAWSQLLGTVLAFGVLAPAMHARGVITTVKYSAIVQWTLWGGAAILIATGLVAFLSQWRGIASSFGTLLALFGGKRPEAHPIDAVECPGYWFPLGLLVLGPVVVALMKLLFGIPVWVGVLTLPLGVVLGFMAARVTGETDTTPSKALGPPTQLLYGMLLPGQMAANVMGANVTAGMGLHAADLLTDLKTGYLLGAKPRQQFYAQLIGTVVGAAAVVPAFQLLVPDASVLGSQRFPAPSAQVWAGVSRVLTSGVDLLHPTARLAAAVGFAVGITLTLLERWAPQRWRRFVPSATGLGLGMVITGASTIAMFVGALLAGVLRRARPSLAERSITPVACGFIAGESLMGVLIAMLSALGVSLAM